MVEQLPLFLSGEFLVHSSVLPFAQPTRERSRPAAHVAKDAEFGEEVSVVVVHEGCSRHRALVEKMEEEERRGGRHCLGFMEYQREWNGN